MENKNIFVTQPFLPPLEEFIPYLEDIWDRKWLTNNGHYHQELEKALCKYLGVKYISLFSNGTLALITALQALRITGEVITTPYSFVATTHALWWNGIKPVFVDVESDYFNIDPEKVEAAITPKTSAILAVHVYGNPCKVDRIQEIADNYGLKVIYDACHTFGVKIKNVPVLNFGDLSVMSFHATKVYNTFEGGAIVCHDAKMKERIDHLKNFGFVDETIVVTPGINGKMNEFQAALGLLQLNSIEKVISRRKEITKYYRDSLSSISGIRFLEDIDEVDHCYSYFPILVDSKHYGCNRDELYSRLKTRGILTRRYFYPLISQFPSYRSLESAQKGQMPIAENVAELVLCLPLYPNLKDNEIEFIIDCIAGVSL